MQLSITHILAVAVLATSAAAASSVESSSNLVVRSASGLKAHGAAHSELLERAAKHPKSHASASAATRKGIKRIENDLKLLEILKGNKEVTREMERPILLDLKKHTASASSSLAEVLKGYSTVKRDAKIVDPATKQLVVDLNNVLSKVNKLVNELFHNLGADKLNDDLVVPLGKTLATVVKSLESKLLDLSPELGKLIDPVVNEVSSDLSFLGLQLRSEEEDFSSDLVERKEAHPHKALEKEVQGHLDTITHDLAKLETLKASGKLDTPAAKALIKEVLKDASAASKSIKHVLKSAKGGKGKKRADEGIFGTLLYRLVHDLVCVLHAVIKLTVNLLGNLGLKNVKELVKDIDGGLLEPLFDGLKSFSKDLGGQLSPELDPLLVSVQDLLSKLGLA
ncbi:hypothetical protein CF319_g746 [Tilletia indica]|nr:hypothetical protein CF319_g746 [Tilletia indica]